MDIGCPICLETMSKADLGYPTLCSCGYNFCLSCVEHMIESAKSPPAKGSDGTQNVRLKLKCPQVRIKYLFGFTKPPKNMVVGKFPVLLNV